LQFDLNANVAIRNLSISNGITFQNAGNQTLTVAGDATIDGPVSVNSSLQLQFQGATTIAGGVTLTNGSSVLNTGALTINGAGTAAFSSTGGVGAAGYTLRNESSVVVNRPGATQMFTGYVIENAGTFQFVNGQSQGIDRYTQTSGTTIINAGTTLSGNLLTFN